MFPSSYDLREMGLVSSVKDQGQWGTCWAHTTYASLESAILKKAKTTHSEESASEASEITLSRADAIMGSDAAITLAKKILPLNLDDKSVKWISSDDKVVTVDANGTIRSVGNGVASVSASTNAGGRVAECSVIVDSGDIPKTVTLESHSLRKDVGDKFMVAYSVNPVTADDENMTWISDNTNTASVSDNGVIEVVGEGSANISIISEGIIMDTVTVSAGSGFNLEVAGIDNSEPDSAAVTILNKASSPQSATVMLGIYKNDRLAGTKLITQVFAPGESTVKLDGISSELKEGCTYKCMLWNAASDMTPMSATMAK
jgi:transglutaminase/protease-like cytokinesis protein 3